MVTNNRITEITHLTGFDLSLTFRGQLDHIDSFNFNDQLLVCFVWISFSHSLFYKILSKANANAPGKTQWNTVGPNRRSKALTFNLETVIRT